LLFVIISISSYFCIHSWQIRVWQVRGRVPVAVESTADLLEALLMDLKGASDHCATSYYAMTIVRYVAPGESSCSIEINQKFTLIRV
jgi:hypothetical protein